jgi:hypothetical protein
LSSNCVMSKVTSKEITCGKSCTNPKGSNLTTVNVCEPRSAILSGAKDS